MDLSAPAATLASDQGVLFPQQLSGVLFFDLPHSLRAVSTPGWRWVLLLLTAQRKVKQREGHALGWWAVVRLAGWSQGCGLVGCELSPGGLAQDWVKEEEWYGVGACVCGKQQPCA